MWYRVDYYEPKENIFTKKMFMDYEDAIEFAETIPDSSVVNTHTGKTLWRNRGEK